MKISYDIKSRDTFEIFNWNVHVRLVPLFKAADESSIFMWVTEDFTKITSSGPPSLCSIKYGSHIKPAFLTNRVLAPCGGSSK